MLLSGFSQSTSAHSSAYSLLKLYKQNYVLCTFSTLLVVCVLCVRGRVSRRLMKLHSRHQGPEMYRGLGPNLALEYRTAASVGTCAVKCVPIKVLLCTIVQVRNLHQ